MWKNTGKLADGRELINFDESPGLHRAELPNRRDLSADTVPAHDQAAAEAQLRWDSLGRGMGGNRGPAPGPDISPAY